MVPTILEKVRNKWNETVAVKETPEIIFLKYILSLLDRDSKHRALAAEIESARTIVGRVDSVRRAVGWKNLTAAFSNWTRQEALKESSSLEYQLVKDELEALGNF